MKANVLVVDDDDDTAELLAELLCRRGYEASSVASAHACLERVAHQRIDLVITDLQMAGMSGVELCQALHELHPELRTLVLTGLGGFDAVTAAMQAGATAHLTKPVNIAALDLAIVRALEPHASSVG